MLRAALILTFALILIGCSPKDSANKPTEKASPVVETPAGEAQTLSVQELSFQAPKGWSKDTPKSRMRLLQMSLPNDAGAGELAVFRFSGGAGSIQANIDRWVGQFAAPEGGKVTPKVEKIDVNGLSVTHVELQGTYVAPVTPRSQERNNESGWAMYGAIVEGKGAPFFIKVVGPAATLDANAKDWKRLLQSLEAK